MNTVVIVVAVVLVVVSGVVCYRIGRRRGGEGERVRQNEIREQTRRLKQEMTGNIAHELRTPVTSIRGFLEILLTGTPDAATSREYLNRAHTQTQTLSELISDMTLLARIDEKRGEFEFSDIDAAALLDQVSSDTSAARDEKGIAMRVDLSPGLVLRGNKGLVYSVFRNLVDNVVAHAGPGVEIRIAAVDKGGPMVRFVFSDTGVGIADERHLERLFERFYRVGEGRTRAGGGSGLGLSIVKNTVALHGGTISVRNGAGGGLEFSFSLPVK